MEPLSIHDFDERELHAHAESMRRLARSLVQEQDVAEDASQEAWLAALRPRATGVRSMAAWLTTAVRQSARNLVRGERRRKRREAHIEEARSPERPEAELERADVMRAVASAVASLDEPFREAIVLHFYESLAPREIAARLHVPDATVRSRLRRGLEALRGQLLRERADDDGRARSALLALAGWRTKGRGWRRPLVLISSGIAICVALALVDAQFEYSLADWVTGARRAPHAEPRVDSDPAMSPKLFPVVAALAALPASGQDALRPELLFDEVVASFEHPLEPCGSRACARGAESRCASCAAIMVDDERFARLRDLLGTKAAAWESVGARARQVLCGDAASDEMREGVLNVLIQSSAPQGAEVPEGSSAVFSRLLEDCSSRFATAHLIALARLGRADAADALSARAADGEVRANAYLAEQGVSVDRSVLERALAEELEPLELVIAGSALRSLGDEFAFDACVSRIQSSILAATEEQDLARATERLAAAEHLMRTFGPDAEPRTFLGQEWWRWNTGGARPGWRPGAADPLAFEIRFVLRMMGTPPLSASALRTRVAALGAG